MAYVKNLSKNQKQVLELMYEMNQPWFGAGMFVQLCEFQRPTLTMRSLERRGLVEEVMEVQMDIEGADEEVETGMFGLTEDGSKWVVRRFRWFENRGFERTAKSGWKKKPA